MDRGYRKDIEGLRALAVAPIVLFHLNAAWCPGGFIGVDIFFVISGYLITRLILADAARFSFREFYVRRFFRLFPALLVTLIATVAAGWWLLGPSAYMSLAKSALSAIPGLSNVYFWTTLDYFDASGVDHPLLHTWSLGVEEQFYLVWPALLFATRFSLARLPVLAVGVGAASLAAVVLVQPFQPQAVFYMMPFRMFEFAIGAGVIVLEQRREALPAWLGEGLEWAAIAVLASCLVLASGDGAWPGLATLAPALATAALLCLGGRGSVGRILSLGPIRFVGRISYALYLVHWPVVTLYRTHRIVEPDTLELLAVGLATVGLAVALHVLVEQPFRHARRGLHSGVAPAAWSRKLSWSAAPSLAVGVVALVAWSANVLAMSGFPSRLDRQRVQGLDKGLTFAGDLCSSRRAECVFGDRSSTRTVFLIGDSHALNLVYGLDRLFAAHGLKGIAFYDHGCLFAAGSVTYVNGVVDPKCARNVAHAYDYLATRSEPVVIAMDYTGYRGAAGDAGAGKRAGSGQAEYLAWLAGRLQSAIARLAPGRRPVVIFKQGYSTGINLPKCLSRPGLGKAEADRQCAPVPRTQALAQSAAVDAAIDALAQRLPGLVAVDPKRVFCDTEACRTSDAEGLFFRDTDHLTNAGSSFLIDRLQGQLHPVLGRPR